MGEKATKMYEVDIKPRYESGDANYGVFHDGNATRCQAPNLSLSWPRNQRPQDEPAIFRVDGDGPVVLLRRVADALEAEAVAAVSSLVVSGQPKGNAASKPGLRL
jgi:hypothetical protein